MKAIMFIVPIHAVKVEMSDAEIQRKIVLGDSNELAKAFNYKINGKPVEFNVDEQLVQVWVSGGTSENWADHGLPTELYSLEMIQKGELPLYATRLPTFIPAKMLEGVKEGDILTFELNGKTAEVTASQQGYRYQSFGNFEEVFKQVTAE
jgi:hypothetical protein